LYASNTGAFGGEEVLINSFEDPTAAATWIEEIFENGNSYTYYRLTHSGGAAYTVWNEIEMMECLD